jgi:hypothetical protein
MTLETYLKTATKGLYGRKKLEVKTEIEGNIKELALEYQIAGFSEANAISQAILDFGKAQDLNAGMVKVHTIPKMIKAVLLAGLLSSVALVGVSSSLAEILTSSVGPYPTCPEEFYDYTKIGDCSSESAWMRLSDFASDVTKAGGVFTQTQLGFAVKFPGEQEIHVPLLESPDLDMNNGQATIKGDVQFQKNQETWVNLAHVIGRIAEKSTQFVTLEGWENPVLRIGETNLKLVTGSEPLAAFYIHVYGVMRQIFRESDRKALPSFTYVSPVLTAKSDPILSTLNHFKHQISVNDKPGIIYAVLTKNYDRLTTISLAPVASDGTLTLWLAHSKVNFVDTLEKLDPYQRLVDPPAVLVKLSGRLDTKAPKLEIVVPAITKSSTKF